EMAKGLAASVDRLTASADALSTSLVKANEGWLTGITDAAGKVVGLFNDLSDGGKQAVGAIAGIGTAITGGGLIFALGRFVLSVNTASAALQTMAARAALPAGAALAAPAAAAAAGGAAATGAALLGAGSAIGVAAGLYFQQKSIHDFTDEQLDDQIADWADPDWAVANAIEKQQRQGRNRNRAWDKVPAPGRQSRFSKYEPTLLDDSTSEYLRSGDAGGSSGGWTDSIRSIGQPQGFKDVSVTGTVTGSAELHNSLQIEVQPTAYFTSLVKRAESIVNMGVNGKLGTSMQGPGDNGTKPSAAALTGTQ
ncbi:hypothetical protein, partial [Bradyrhizobium sp. STM 3809]|uniref:hypothetical protein n=1 Tax=Bradyrhizobium sp. STM 3809 TaxID=551936 RepID=UPI0005592C4F